MAGSTVKKTASGRRGMDASAHRKGILFSRLSIVERKGENEDAFLAKICLIVSLPLDFRHGRRRKGRAIERQSFRALGSMKKSFPEDGEQERREPGTSAPGGVRCASVLS